MKQSASDRELNLLELSFSRFRQVYFICKFIWNIAVQDNRVARDAYTYRFNKPRKPEWTRRRSRPVYKVTACVVQSETSPTDQVPPRCPTPKKLVRTCILYIVYPSQSSSNRLARLGLWLRYRGSIRSHAGRVRSRWISLAIRQIDRIRCSRDHARIITRSPIAPWHFPFRTVGSKLRLGKRRHVREHQLSITRSDMLRLEYQQSTFFFFWEPSLSHTRK